MTGQVKFLTSGFPVLVNSQKSFPKTVKYDNHSDRYIIYILYIYVYIWYTRDVYIGANKVESIHDDDVWFFLIK